MRYTSLLESRIYNQVCYPLLGIDTLQILKVKISFSI